MRIDNILLDELNLLSQSEMYFTLNFRISSYNVRYTEKLTKCRSNILLRLVSFSA